MEARTRPQCCEKDQIGDLSELLQLLLLATTAGADRIHGVEAWENKEDEIKGIKEGIEIRLKGKKKIEHRGEKLKPQSILIRCPTLNKVLGPSESTNTWVGGKFGGIYVGFRKPEIERMERIAREKFGMVPT